MFYSLSMASVAVYIVYYSQPFMKSLLCISYIYFIFLIH